MLCFLCLMGNFFLELAVGSETCILNFVKLTSDQCCLYRMLSNLDIIFHRRSAVITDFI